MVKILVIDDESCIITLFQRFLEQYQVELQTCQNQTELEQLLQRNVGDYELCFVDFYFHDMTANDIILRLHQWSPCMACIVMSGDPDQLQHLQTGPICSTLPKPFSLDQLRAIIQQKGIQAK